MRFDFRSSCALVTAASIALGSAGCATLPKTGVEATGEPLNVEINTETHTYVTQAKVGEVVNRDSSGRVVGTSEVYENRVGTYDVTRWQAFQGADEIDDQDLFRIAGDIKTAKAIADYRKSGVTLNRVGMGLLIGGGALLGAGLIASNALKTEVNGIEEKPAWPTAVAGVGILAMLFGGTWMWYGHAKATTQHPHNVPEHADKVARKYNQALKDGTAPGANDDEDDEDADEEEEPAPKKKKKR